MVGVVVVVVVVDDCICGVDIVVLGGVCGFWGWVDVEVVGCVVKCDGVVCGVVGGVDDLVGVIDVCGVDLWI